MTAAFFVIATVSTCGVRGVEPIQLPFGQSFEAVDFERHVAPLLSRLGCNAGACHGASEGQGGFHLSLFGYDAAMDYAALMEEGSGRVDTDDVANSLILLKPTLAIDHEGGLRFERDSWEYRLIERWIANGAEHVPGSGELLRLEVSPGESLLTETKPSVRVRVTATFVDAESLDVTPLSTLRIQDDTIASLEPGGTLCRTAAGGDTAIVATYNGRPASAYVLVPRADETEPLTTPTHGESLIDRHVSDKLRRLGIEPSPRCSDAAFLRRITLATIGQLPTPGEIRGFIADSARDKRDRKINALLNDPLHASRWATRMCEITGSRDFGESGMRPDPDHEHKWHAWFRVRFADNVPYDRLVRDVICATTREQQATADFIASQVRAVEEDVTAVAETYADRDSFDLFWQRPKVNEEIDVEGITERIAAAFLGIRIECARCHKHPFDRWTRNDHRSFSNVFTQVRFGLSPALRSGLVDAIEEQRVRAREGKDAQRVPRMREVYLSPTCQDLRDPATGRGLPVKPLGGEVIQTDGDRREVFADWLTSGVNPYFARNFVNRVWFWYFGVGLVNPVDAFSAGNPPSHPRLLEELARDFVEHGFNIRRLERQILRSAAWQRAATVNDTSRNDHRNFARAYVRMLPADVVVDAISCAIGDQDVRAVEMALRHSGDESLDTYLDIFHRPERKLTCDCEQSEEPTLRQTMLLLSDPSLMERIRTATVARLAESEASDQEIVDEFFLSTLSRWPDCNERAAALKHVKSSSDRRSGLGEVMWGLLNTREFVTNH